MRRKQDRGKGKWCEGGGCGLILEGDGFAGRWGSRWNAIQRDISSLSAVMHILQQAVASASYATRGYRRDCIVYRTTTTTRSRIRGIMLETEGRGGQEKEVLDLLSAAFPDAGRRVGKGL